MDDQERDKIKANFESRLSNIEGVRSDFVIGGKTRAFKTEKEYDIILNALQMPTSDNYSLRQNYKIGTARNGTSRLQQNKSNKLIPRMTELFDLIQKNHLRCGSVEDTKKQLDKCSEFNVTKDLVQQYCNVCPGCRNEFWKKSKFTHFQLLLRSTINSNDEEEDDEDEEENSKFKINSRTLRLKNGETQEGTIMGFDENDQLYEVQYHDEGVPNEKEYLQHDELVGGLSASLKRIVEEQEIKWDPKEQNVVKIFSFSSSTYKKMKENKQNREKIKDYHQLDKSDKNSPYTDGCRLQCYTEKWNLPKFDYIIKQIEDQLKIITNQPEYELCNCVILNTTETTCIRQELHTDWESTKKGKKRGSDEMDDKDKLQPKYFILIAIDSGQTLNVKTTPSNKHHAFTTVNLFKDCVYIGNRDCIHGGSSNSGLRFHAMFVPKGEKKAPESQINFDTDDNLRL